MHSDLNEKRGIATHVPVWKKENCIQCNQCAYVCPHAVLRPFLATDEELADAPGGFETIKADGVGMENYNYRIQVDALDCTGCTVCVEVCPAPNKAIVMEPIENSLGQKEGSVDQMENWYYALKL